MTQRFHLLICVVATGLILASTSAAQAQTIWYVDDANCPGPGTGTQEDPFCTIQQAVDASVDGDEVIVADGIYTGANNRPQIEAKGITVRSANGPANCVIDAEQEGRGITIGSVGESVTEIRGFTIINGHAGYGGGISVNVDVDVDELVVLIIDCIIRNCEATSGEGGGVYCFATGDGEVSITNCIINGNTANTRGGGIYGEGVWRLWIINCTIFGNSAFEGGGVFFTACNAVLYSSILWNNNAPTGPEGYVLGTGRMSIWSSNVDGGRGSFVNDLDDPGEYDFCWGDGYLFVACLGIGMLDDDPLFVDPNNNDFHLQADSPCIDTGRTREVPEFCTTDLDGEPRIFNRIVDMGADEYNDCNNNEIFDYQEISDCDGSLWCSDCNENGVLDECEADCNQNDIPDECDISSGYSLDDDNNGIPDECGDILRVPDHYPTIQSAVDAADEGYTVLVADGIYTGPANRVQIGDPYDPYSGKSITIRSENGPENCVIDCEHEGIAFAVMSIGESPFEIRGFTIINGYGGKYRGGGINLSAGGNAVIADCIIRNCKTIGTSYWGNKFGGGGIYCGGTTINNCVITGNTSDTYGGGILCYESSTITNCTISNNSALKEGGGVFFSFSNTTMSNCILRDNTAPTGKEGYLYSSGGLDISYCNVEGGQNSFAMGGGIVGPELNWLEGNIDVNPSFVNPDNDDYHLQADSPCINAGDNNAPGVPEYDLEGNDRIQQCRVDMGAYETPYYLNDCNTNGAADACDIAEGISEDCNENHIPDECEPGYELDCNGNLEADFCDIYVGDSEDCNDNGIPDECDIVSGTSGDCNENGIPDECEPGGGDGEDCNNNGTPDLCDIYNGTSEDCNENAIPDECEPGYELDCNGNLEADFCDIYVGTSEDCNENTIPDECDLASGTSEDCNENYIPDECDIASGTSYDCNANSVPDDCETLGGVPQLYVDSDAVGADDGTSWHDALTDLQVALCLAEIDPITTEIWVTVGTYTPSERTDPQDPSTATFRLINNVTVYGGFEGTEESLDERAGLFNQTILSGDLNGNDVGDLDDPSRAENSYHVVTGSNTNTTAVLDGVTIMGGNAHGGGYEGVGGGMFNDHGSPTIINCTFRDNSADYGGGVLNSYGSPTITNCIFRNNEAMGDNDHYGYSGGGMTNRYSSPTIINCTFMDNSAYTGAGKMFRGAGIDNSDSSPTITNCTFLKNNGGGIYCYKSSPTISNCSIVGNISDRNEASGVDCFASNATISNCVLWDNVSDMDGSGGGPFSDETAQIYYNSTPTPIVNYSCIQGCTTFCADPNDHNIGDYPLFVDPANDDYHLQDGSPCIDVGDNSAVEEHAVDIDGEPRIGDGNGNEEEPGVFATVDMGADEYHDCNANGVLDYLEIASGASEDCNENGIPDECEPGGGEDCNNNGTSDLCDIYNGTSEDCNDNSIPDECEQDCNRNDIPDDCDIAEGTSYDCNANEVPDECDIRAGTSQDCNGNSIPDECDLVGTPLGQWTDGVIDFSSQWSSPAWGAVQVIGEPDVQQWGEPIYQDDLRAWAPLLMDNPDGEHITVSFVSFAAPVHATGVHATGVRVIESWRGTSLAHIGVIGPGDVGFVTRVELLDTTGVFHTIWEGVDESQLQIHPQWGFLQPAIFEVIFAETPYRVQGVRINIITDRPEEVVTIGGQVFDLSDWEEIDAIQLLGLSYQAEDCNGNNVPDRCDIAEGTSEDCNGNRIPDECDIAEGTSEDCQPNGIPDECDIANDDGTDDGTSEDCNENGIPDECEQAPCAICDLNNDGKVDKEDLKIMERCLSQETPVIPDDCKVADLDGDGLITEIDWKLFIKCYWEYVSPSSSGIRNLNPRKIVPRLD